MRRNRDTLGGDSHFHSTSAHTQGSPHGLVVGVLIHGHPVLDALNEGDDVAVVACAAQHRLGVAGWIRGWGWGVLGTQQEVGGQDKTEYGLKSKCAVERLNSSEPGGGN